MYTTVTEAARTTENTATCIDNFMNNLEDSHSTVIGPFISNHLFENEKVPL